VVNTHIAPKVYSDHNWELLIHLPSRLEESS